MSSYLQGSSHQSADDFNDFIDFNGGIDANYAPEDTNTSFSGPSHEYHSFPQQTGFPSGSMSNVSAYNDMNMDSDFMSPPDFNSSYVGPVDGFNNSQVSYSMDFDQTRKALAYSNMDDFVDPSAVYEAPAPVRMWPGMHSQQAEQAKATALAKQQQSQLQNQHLAQQQRRQSQQQHYQQQQPSSVTQGKMRSNSNPMVDPVAERKITDILDNMRHKSNISPIDEEDDDSHSSRARRDEDDMDEDERLLASEEGKKLSSKERRQLRNKVSARAFRSRRKEYIGQLEGDLANKANEANDLRLINRKLLEENNQLKNLTRTVLSHPAFHTFLEDMSRNPTFVPPPAHMTAPMMPAPPETLPSSASQQPEIKHEQLEQQQFQPQEDVQINMAHMSNNNNKSLDLSMLNLGINNKNWGQPQAPSFNYQQPQVFAVFEVPAGPTAKEVARPVAAAPRRQFPTATPVAVSPCSVSIKSSSLASGPWSVSQSSSIVKDCVAHINTLFDTIDPSSKGISPAILAR